MSKYREMPVPTTGVPRGIPYIIGNELAERFSFYGMKGILTVFMTKHLLDSSGASATMTDENAKAVYHLFTAAAYFFPIVGSLLSDIFWGKYKTIIILSLGYCIGHLCLAIMDLGPVTGAFDMQPWLFAGLIFIAVGAGGIKPCVSAHVGDQFGEKNKHLVSKMFSWFYFSINVGAMASTLLTPVLLAKVGPWAAFGLPGVLMAIATFVFWLGRNEFVHVPAAGWRKFKEETFSSDGLRAVFNLSPIFLIFVPVFWALFDQTGSAWVLQASKMDRQFLGVEWYESQVQAVNPFLILVLIPTFAYFVYPAVDKIFRMTPLRKIGIGLFLTAGAFAVPGLIEENISGGDVSAVTSKSSVETVAPVGLIDGVTGELGWTSGEAPNEEVAQEIMIRLRERRAWSINEVTVDPRTSFDLAEVFAAIAKIRSAQNDAKNYVAVEQIDAITRELHAMEDQDASAGAIAARGQALLTETGFDATSLDLASYAPKAVRVFTGQFGNGLSVPKLHSSKKSELIDLHKAINDAKPGADLTSQRGKIAELEAEHVHDLDAWLPKNGWVPVGTLTFDDASVSKAISFDARDATHVLIRIESNHGGPRVKLGEISVSSADSMPASAPRGAEDVWPNVAALGFKPNIGWQFLAYLLLTAAEVMVSIVSLEFAYTQAPKKMKSFIMGIYFLGVSLGNLFTSGVNFFIQNDDDTTKLEGASYYWFFTLLMLVTAVIFVIYSQFYKGRTYIQGEDADEAALQADLVEPGLAGPGGEHGQHSR